MGLFSHLAHLLPLDSDGRLVVTPFVSPPPITRAPAISFVRHWPAPAPTWRPNGKEFFIDALHSSLGSTAGEITAICKKRPS